MQEERDLAWCVLLKDAVQRLDGGDTVVLGVVHSTLGVWGQVPLSTQRAQCTNTYNRLNPDQ